MTANTEDRPVTDQTLHEIEAVPFVDLTAINSSIHDEVSRAWDKIVATGQFVLGDEVSLFETELAAYYGTGECVSVGNGTDALEVALRALGIGVGDEVIVPAFTFAASGIAVVRAGATPVFVDVDPATLLIDPASAAAVVGPRTAAVMAVNLYGQIGPRAELQALAARHGLALIEDGAQSQGAAQDGARCGDGTSFVCTSFYPTKNLGAWGDGGALLTADPELAAKARLIRNYGSATKYDHTGFGFNTRLDTVQAAVLRAKLPHLDQWNKRRAAAASLYSDLLAEMFCIKLPAIAAGNTHVWHLYAVRVSDRDRLLRELNERGVGAGVHYPGALHLLPMFAGLGYRAGALPASEEAAATVLSLPLFVGITGMQQTRVASVLGDLVGGCGR